MYFIEKNLTKLKNTNQTFFLDPKELNQVKSKLKKGEYDIYYPYKDSEKNIIFIDNEPEVLLYEIIIKVPVRHQDIMGAMYSLNISNELFGDILIINNRYFIYILPIVRNYFESNFLMVKNAHVELKELDINYSIISSVIRTGRSNINDYIKKKEIILNYDYLKDTSYKLKEGDTFSIKRIGKYKYNGIIKKTKSNHLIIEVLKYL